MNSDTISGKFDEAVGKAKQGIGESTGDQQLANSGVADQVKGNAKETWGNVKDAASDAKDQYQSEAHASAENAKAEHAETGNSLRDKIVQGATDIKNSIEEKVDEFRANHK